MEQKISGTNPSNGARILIATPLLTTQSGGPGQYAYGLKNALEKSGYGVDVISFSLVAHLPTVIRHIVLCVRALIKMRSVDTVIVLDSLSMALPVVLASVLTRKEAIVRIGGDFVWEHYVERTHEPILLREFYTRSCELSLKERIALWVQKNIVIRFASWVVFSTAWQKELWGNPYALRSECTRVIENSYSLSPQRQRVKNKQRVVWCGRDLVLKNVASLTSAVEQVRSVYPECEYEAYTNIPHEKVLSVLGEAGVLVIPSFSEVSPNIVFEAFSVGIPVILTRECGLYSLLTDAVVWIDPMDVDDIASKITMSLSEDGYNELLKKMNSFANERTYDAVAQDFISLMNHE